MKKQYFLLLSLVVFGPLLWLRAVCQQPFAGCGVAQPQAWFVDGVGGNGRLLLHHSHFPQWCV